MTIADVFKKRFPNGNLFFIQAGLDQPMARVAQLGRVYPLPGAFVNRRNFREPPYQLGTDMAKRGRVCMDTVSKQSPDLFLTETFPLGWEESRRELMPTLVRLSSQGAAVWSVAGHPLVTGIYNEWRDKIIGFYNRIIIFSPALEMRFMADAFPLARDRRRYLDFFKINSSKITFANYLLPKRDVVQDDPEQTVFGSIVPRGACRVTVVRGGGAFYPKVIAQAICASDLLGVEYYFMVVAGPSTTKEEWQLFTALVRKKKVNNLTLFKSVGEYEALIKESDVCVAMGGYNTSVLLLRHRKKAVIIPFEGYGKMSFYEQPARAALMKEMIGARILSIDKLTAKVLAAAVKTAAGKAVRSNIPENWFTGRSFFDRALTASLATKSMKRK